MRSSAVTQPLLRRKKSKSAETPHCSLLTQATQHHEGSLYSASAVWRSLLCEASVLCGSSLQGNVPLLLPEHCASHAFQAKCVGMSTCSIAQIALYSVLPLPAKVEEGSRGTISTTWTFRGRSIVDQYMPQSPREGKEKRKDKSKVSQSSNQLLTNLQGEQAQQFLWGYECSRFLWKAHGHPNPAVCWLNYSKN